MCRLTAYRLSCWKNFTIRHLFPIFQYDTMHNFICCSRNLLLTLTIPVIYLGCKIMYSLVSAQCVSVVDGELSWCKGTRLLCNMQTRVTNSNELKSSTSPVLFLNLSRLNSFETAKLVASSHIPPQTCFNENNAQRNGFFSNSFAPQILKSLPINTCSHIKRFVIYNIRYFCTIIDFFPLRVYTLFIRKYELSSKWVWFLNQRLRRC